MENLLDNDTICAISTPHGMGGIAVVRVSGPSALAIVAKRWQGKPLSEMKSHTAHLGRLLDTGGDLLDEVVLTVFLAPHSFTGEDVVEIACHGSLWIQQQAVRALIDAGCRMATGGEFTRRAFAAGKMDLSQAEAVADVIAAQSRAAHHAAMSQMRGAFSHRLKQLREKLLEFTSLIELELDFSEEDVEFASRPRLMELATGIDDGIERLVASYQDGNAIKNGLPIAIVGATNAGKSTLLNALLHDDRALVSDVRGTTRDVIEDTIVMGGTLFRFIDTAGLRQSSDAIEAMGIKRAVKKLGEARIVLWVIDSTASQQEAVEAAQYILPQCKGKTLIAVINKVDKATGEQVLEAERQARRLTAELDSVPVVRIAAKQETGLDALQQAIASAAALPGVGDDGVVVTNARHYEALRHAGEAIKRVISGLRQGLSGDFLSQDLRECLHYLGEITGEITTDEVLSTIFSRFCIGK